MAPKKVIRYELRSDKDRKEYEYLRADLAKRLGLPLEAVNDAMVIGVAIGAYYDALTRSEASE